MTEAFRQTPPAPLAPKPFNIAVPFEARLANGLRVIILENRRLPIVNFRLAFRFGEINSPENQRGLASAVSSLLTQGTEKRSSRELAEEVEKLGASLHASTSSDNTILSCSSLSMYRSQILELMSEVLFKPTFPEDELALYKENTLKGLEFQRSQADFLAEEQTARIIYGDHPYGTVSPSPENIRSIERSDLIGFQSAQMIPNNALLIAVGDVDRDELLKELDSVFGGWQAGTIGDFQFAQPPVRTKRTLTVVDRIGSAQSNIVLANLAINRNHPDYFPVILMNQILGAGASSRLFMNIREDKGYTYGAYSSFDTRRLLGAFEATAEVRGAVTGDSLKEFFYEINRIRDERVTDAEIQDAKDYLTGVFPIRAETQEGLTNLIVSQKLNNLPEDYLQTYRDRISAVTVDEVLEAANRHLHPDKLAIVVVGDAEEILKQSASYAEDVVVFDSEGVQQELSKYQTSGDAKPADIGGKWEVTIQLQGQSLPVSIEMEQQDSGFGGTLTSAFGNGVISDGVVSGNKLKAAVRIDFQGQPVDVSLSAVAEDGKLNGLLVPQMDGIPELPFSGSRE